MPSTVRDWRIELIEKHPKLFHPPVRKPEATQGYPICGDGWRDLLERLCTKIEAAIAESGGWLRVLQIEEKYGTLRFYWRGELSDESRTKVEEAIALAEARSACTCEKCGEEGRLYRHGRMWMTRCPAHAKGDPVRIEGGLESFHVIRLIELHDMRVFFLPRLRPRCRRIRSRPADSPRGVAKMACFRGCGEEGTFDHIGLHACTNAAWTTSSSRSRSRNWLTTTR